MINSSLQKLHFFETPTAVLSINRQATGTRFEANAIFSGKNRQRGAMLTFVFNPDLQKEQSSKKKEKVKMEVINSKGQVIRTINHDVEAGINRIYWDLRRKGVRSPNTPIPTKADSREPGGPSVLPGLYTVKLSHGKNIETKDVTVISDPRVGINKNNLVNLQPVYNRQMRITNSITEVMDRIREAQNIVPSVDKLLDLKNKTHKGLQKNGKIITDSLKVLEELILNKKGLQGIVRSPNILSGKVSSINRYLYNNLSGPNQSHDYLLDYAEQETNKVLKRVNSFFAKNWEEYKLNVDDADLSLFKDYEKIKIK